jgi:hypothetical protein
VEQFHCRLVSVSRNMLHSYTCFFVCLFFLDQSNQQFTNTTGSAKYLLTGLWFFQEAGSPRMQRKGTTSNLRIFLIPEREAHTPFRWASNFQFWVFCTAHATDYTPTSLLIFGPNNLNETSHPIWWRRGSLAQCSACAFLYKERQCGH